MLVVNNYELSHAFQVSEPHGSRKLIHFTISANGLYTVVTREAKVDHLSDFVRQNPIIGCNHATFQAIEEFGCMKTKDFGISKVAYHLPPV